MGGRALIFGLALLVVGLVGNPWKHSWKSIDDVIQSADDFVLSQGRSPENYSLAHVVRLHPDGLWSEHTAPAAFAMNPAFTHQLRLYRRGWDDWTLDINRDGRIIRLLHDEEEDTPGERLLFEQARDSLYQQMDSVLALPRSELVLARDTLIPRPQRTDFIAEFRWPGALPKNQRLQVGLFGKHLGLLDVVEDTLRAAPKNPPLSQEDKSWRRWGGVLLIFLVAAVVFIQYRGAFAWGPAAFFSGVFFVFFLLVHLLRLHFYEIAVSAAPTLQGVFWESAKGVLIAAVQSAFVVGLVVAIGEVLSRRRQERVATLTRLPPALDQWSPVWISAAKAALPWAILILLVEAGFSRVGKPAGFMNIAAQQMAYVLSSPVPLLTATLQTLLHAIWQETIFRFFALAVLVYWFRSHVLAVVFSAALATYFGCSSVAPSCHQGLWFVWSIIAAMLVLRAGIRAAFLLHLMVLGGTMSLLLLWTGLGQGGWVGGVFLGLLLLILFSIGVWRENMRRFAS